MPTHAEKRIIPYTAEQIFQLVADVEQYPDFLPWAISSKVLSRSEDRFIAEVTVGYKFIQDSYRSEVILSPYNRIDVNYIEGPFRYLNNHWAFEEISASSVAIDFYIDFEFRSSILQHVIQPIFSEAVKMMINAFEKRAQDLYPQKNQSQNFS